ncbi:uncharacterized protein LOC130624249 isoform X1 [Hydractinia symbiolongicarpus]|uniref:uncharacterized protein LOC130624249 isoform X1 n=1 Tax=Hydractinia symbiolongicarpus TaxID=13093 RepID=UPI00254BB4B0|nr:uncharacterized protein LOC130624249 isoform X1 [Hydractinia symbiolongicarpus]
MSLPELNKESIAFGLKVFSTTALGLYAGQSLYINAVEVPANLDHEPEHSLQNWQRNFHHASHFAPKVHGAGVLAAVGHYLLTRGTDNEDLPFLLSQLIGELNVPITFGIIMPVNNQLHDQDDCKTKELLLESELKSKTKLYWSLSEDAWRSSHSEFTAAVELPSRI